MKAASEALRLRIAEMLDAIGAAEDLIGGLEFDTYETLRGQRRGVERCMEIVSHGSRNLPAELTASHLSVDWSDLRAIGAALRVGNVTMDDRAIWLAATKLLPEAEIALKAILASLPPMEK